MSKSGRTEGCTSDRMPGCGAASPHDSSGVWSGRIRCARSLVSSGSDANDTTKSTLASASEKPAPGGSEWTGFTPPSSSTATRPEAIASTSLRISRKLAGSGAAAASAGSSTVVPIAPTTASRISTAAAVAVARWLVSATPGGSAAGRFACAIARPIRWIVSAGTPLREATDSASKPARMPSNSAGSPPTERPRARAVSNAARAMPSARMPSLPGLAGSHSSALPAVSESRGPT